MVQNRRLILASGSPRRHELLKGLNVDFTIDTGNSFEEYVPEGVDPYQVPILMAEGKSHGFHRELADDEILITADTVVIIDGKVLGKPHSREQAVEMLHRLSGRTHEVLTAVVLRDREKTTMCTDVTKVTFAKLSDEEINYYIDTYKPYDKAGAYGVQEWIGYVAIERIEGSFYNVMGLPIHKVYSELKKF